MGGNVFVGCINQPEDNKPYFQVSITFDDDGSIYYPLAYKFYYNVGNVESFCTAEIKANKCAENIQAKFDLMIKERIVKRLALDGLL